MLNMCMTGKHFGQAPLWMTPWSHGNSRPWTERFSRRVVRMFRSQFHWSLSLKTRTESANRVWFLDIFSLSLVSHRNFFLQVLQDGSKKVREREGRKAVKQSSEIWKPVNNDDLPCSNHSYWLSILRPSYYHRVLQPSDSECSNQYLLDLAYQTHPALKQTSTRISYARTKYLGHILPHPSSLEHLIMFKSSGSLRTISSPFRRGAPRGHWPELALAEAQNKVLLHRQSPPRPSQTSHPFYSLLSTPDLKRLRGVYIWLWHSTTDQFQLLVPLAHFKLQFAFPWSASQFWTPAATRSREKSTQATAERCCSLWDATSPLVRCGPQQRHTVCFGFKTRRRISKNQRISKSHIWFI